MNASSARLLLSYLSILIVPLLVIGIIYATASNLMYTVQYERMSAALEQMAIETQQRMDEAKNLGIHISTAKELSKLQKELRKSGQKATYFEMYELSLSFPDYSLFNSAIRDVYFFFNQQDYVMRLPTVVPADERSYASIGPLLADDYDTILQTMSGKYHEMETVTLRAEGTENKLLGVLQSFPFGMRDEPLGTMLILLDDDFITRTMNANLTSDEGVVVMLDSAGVPIKILQGETTGAPNLSEIDFSALPQENVSNFRLNGKSYALCYAKAGGGGHSFYSIVPRSVLLERVGYIKVVIFALSILSVLIGLASCVALWIRKRRVVLRYSRYADEFGGVAEKNGNMWDGLHAVLDSVAQMQTTVRLQSGLVRSGVIHKLLDGEYTQPAILKQELETAGIKLNGALYCVAVITFNRGARFGRVGGETLDEFRLRMHELVDETLDLPNYCCEPEDMLLALIVPLSSQDKLESVKRELRAFEDNLIANEHVEAFLGVGECVGSLMELSESYAQARSVCEYLRFYNIRKVMSYKDLPTSHDMFYFPLEMELRFIRAIEQGNHAELQDLFGQLAVENFATRQLTFETQKRLLELVRCTAMRALPTEETQCGNVRYDAKFKESLEKADSLEQVFVLLEECMPVTAMQSTQMEDKKTEEKKDELRKLIEQNYGREDYTIACIAQQVGVSETKFYKDFKQLFGVSFSEYLENLRIEKACELLKAQMLVKDVSVWVGYNSDYSFRRAFKRVTGITPSAYMEHLK